MELYLARQAGLCYGLRRALRLLENHVRRQGSKSLAVLQPFSDSPTAQESVRKLGIQEVDTLDEVPAGVSLALPLDGLDPHSEGRIRTQGISTLSTTCPRQARVRELAYKLAKEGYPVLVMGQVQEAEAAGILDWAEHGWTEQLGHLGADRSRVFAGCVTQPGDDAFVQVDDDVAHVALLSSPRAELDDLGALTSQGIRRFSQVRAYNTICHSVTSRSLDAAKLAKTCDLVLVMGRPDDSVCKILLASAESDRAKALLVSGPEDLPDLAKEDITKVGLVSSWDVAQNRFVAMVEHLRRTYSAKVVSTL